MAQVSVSHYCQLALLFVALPWNTCQAFTIAPFSTTAFHNSPKGTSFVSHSTGTATSILYSETIDNHDEAQVVESESTKEDDAIEETADGIAAEKPKKLNDPKERHTLFVGNLSFETTEAELRDLFSQHGTVELVLVPKNKETGQSRGFAFVDLSSLEEMQRAVDALHDTDFNGRSIRVAPSLPKDEAAKQGRKIDEGMQKLYVGNLSFEATRDDVMELFSKYGNVKDVYLPLDKNTGGPRGFAFVTLDEKMADKAIEETNGMDFMGRPLAVNLPLQKGEKPATRREARQKLYVGNLAYFTVPDTLRELFEEFGTVHDCYMPEDPNTGGSRGFGFVTLDKDAAQAAIDATDGCELDGRILRVNAAQAK